MPKIIDSKTPDTYDRFRNPKSGFHLEKYSRGIRFVPKAMRGKVLEIGSGTGIYTEFLCRDFKKVVATDIDSGMLELLKKKLPKIDTRTCDCSRLPFAAGSFDAVFGVSILHHVPRKRRELVFSEAKRALKSSGYFVLFEPNKLNLGTLAFQIVQREDAISRFELSSLAEKAGLEKIAVKEILFSEPISQTWLGGKPLLSIGEKIIEGLGLGVSVMGVFRKP